MAHLQTITQQCLWCRPMLTFLMCPAQSITLHQRANRYTAKKWTTKRVNAMSFYSILTDERLKQSTLEDTHDALNSESQWTIVRMSQMRVIFLQQLKRSVSFCITKHKRNRTQRSAVHNHCETSCIKLYRFSFANTVLLFHSGKNKLITSTDIMLFFIFL